MIAAIGAAFAEHPMIPADPSGQKSRMMAVSMLDAFTDAPDHRWFAIRRDGRLACVAFVFAYGYDPPWTKMPVMFWRMIRMFGLRRAVRYGRLMSEKHPGDDRRLQLMILGTLAEYQGQGLGRVMMRHVFDFARQQSYEAVVSKWPSTPRLSGSTSARATCWKPRSPCRRCRFVTCVVIYDGARR